MFNFRLISLTIARNELLWPNSSFSFFSYKGNYSIVEQVLLFLITYLTIFFLVSRDGRVFVCFYRRVPLCLFELLSVVVVVVCCKNVCIVFECCLNIKLRHGPYISNFHIDLQRCHLFAIITTVITFIEILARLKVSPLLWCYKLVLLIKKVQSLVIK